MTDPAKWHVFERDKRTGYCSVCQRPEEGSVHYRRVSEPMKHHYFAPGFPVGGECEVCGGLEAAPIHYRRVSHTKVVHKFAPDEHIVGMMNYRDHIIVATSRGLYRFVDENLEPIQLLREEAKDDGRPNAE